MTPTFAWNPSLVRLTHRHEHIQINHNDKVIVDYQIDRLTRGCIDLQDHDVLKFRNNRITEI